MTGVWAGSSPGTIATLTSTICKHLIPLFRLAKGTLLRCTREILVRIVLQMIPNIHIIYVSGLANLLLQKRVKWYQLVMKNSPCTREVACVDTLGSQKLNLVIPFSWDFSYRTQEIVYRIIPNYFLPLKWLFNLFIIYVPTYLSHVPGPLPHPTYPVPTYPRATPASHDRKTLL